MGFLTRLLAGLVSAATLGAGLSGTANVVGTTTATAGTTGAVTATADDTDGRTVLECRQSGEGATGPYADKFCWIDWSNLPLDRTGEPTPVRISVPGGHIDADATITHTDNAALAVKDYTGSKWSRLTSAYKLTGGTALAFSGRMGGQDPVASVAFSNITPSADVTDTGVNVLKDFQLAFGDAEVMSGGVLQGHDVYERTDIESDKTLEKLGLVGSGDPNQSYSKANTGYGTTHVTLAGGPKGATDDANKDSKGSAVVGAKQASRFKVSFKQVNQHWDGWGSAIAVGVYMPYLTAYPLTYDKNAAAASGEVPSNQRGKENTTQPAASKTNGTVKTVADENVRYGSLANGDFSYPSFSDIQKNEQENHADLRTFLKSDDGTLWYNMSNTDLSKYGKIGQIPGFDSSRFAWSSTENGSRVELQQDRNTKNTYAEIVAQQDNTSIYQNVSTGNGGVLYKIRLKHASRQSSHLDKMQVLVGADMAHATPVEMARVTSNGHGDKVGEKSTTIVTKVSNTDPRDHGAQWETYEGYYQVPEGQKNTVFMFKSLEGFKEDETLSGNNIGNLVDDIEFSRSYKLTYDKNSDDATGSVPSDTTANTVKQAKAKSSGTVRLAADRTDGKVSDLVQRTTTHADGSVTVRTVDTTTDVVSGCQVYYPAGQKITLATMAKDDDCWDSSMLSRPGHTQLGWNQDRNATQAQAEVTMVEGGMAVYAVWVGNPVLTYDTNKPATWSGQMPSTPASVSVAYNTAVTDGSGWRAGDTTKIRGYRFLGWYTGPQDNAGLYDWTRPLTGNVTVYAHWQRLQANVVYNANGGTGSHANTTGWQYSDVTIPGDTSKSFTRDGYVFKGWSLKAGKADVVYKDGSQIPLQDKDITLYAQWQGIHENFTETGGISLPLLIAGGIGLLVMGVGSTVMLTRRMNGHGMPDGE
ncbi:InlB B-repeat-containing protein [Bifidobacterium adolescentis]|uniref:InlB B-repeat-containing protein n=1 Tax=Bifidobacterium adolescentis TaxID=1680 RepID=UPI0034A5AF47